MGASQQRGVEQPLGLSLVRMDDGRPGLNSRLQRGAVGVEDRPHFALARRLDQSRIEVGRRAGWNAAAQHQPFGLVEMANGGLLEPVDLALIHRWTGLVQLDGEALLVGDRQIGPYLLMNRHDLDGKSVSAHQLLEPLSGFAARGENRQRLSSERVNHGGGVDSPSAGRFVCGENVGAIFEHQPVRSDIAIDRWIDS